MTSSTQELVDFAYGPNANLYKDVLKVPRNASKEAIQSAFIDRRYELYGMLQNTSLNDSNGSVISVSERQFTEKKMDALVATFRILYDPAKRLEYNSKLNSTLSRNPDRSPTCVITGPTNRSRSRSLTNRTESTLENGVSDEFGSSIVSNGTPSSLHSTEQRKSTTRQQLFTTQSGGKRLTNEVVKTPTITSTADPVEDLPSKSRKRSSKRSSKRKTNSKQNNANSTNLPSVKTESSRSKSGDRRRQHQPNRANDNSSSPHETCEPILKRVECAAQQTFQEVENFPDTKKTRKGSRNEKNPQADVNNDQETAVEDTLKSIPRLKSLPRSKGSVVTWRDTANHPQNAKKRHIKKSEMDLCEDIENNKDGFTEVNGCLDLQHIERHTDVVESNSLVGFLRSSGFENQAYLVQELRNELRGSIADTLLAVDQVLNAFKIADDDIDAIVGNIRQERNCLVKHIRYS